MGIRCDRFPLSARGAITDDVNDRPGHLFEVVAIWEIIIVNIALDNELCALRFEADWNNYKHYNPPFCGKAGIRLPHIYLSRPGKNGWISAKKGL